MKKLLVFLFTFVLLAGAFTSASADGGDTPYFEFYNDADIGDYSARLIHPTDVQVFEAYAIDCSGERFPADIGSPWLGVGWKLEAGDLRLKEFGALVSWKETGTDTWGDPVMIIGKQSCGGGNTSGTSIVIFQGGNIPCTWPVPNEYFVETGYLKHLPEYLQRMFNDGLCNTANTTYTGVGKFSMEKLWK